MTDEPKSSAPVEKAGELSMTQAFADSFDALCVERDTLRAELAQAREEIAKLREQWEASNAHKNLELAAEKAAREESK